MIRLSCAVPSGAVHLRAASRRIGIAGTWFGLSNIFPRKKWGETFVNGLYQLLFRRFPFNVLFHTFKARFRLALPWASGFLGPLKKTKTVIEGNACDVLAFVAHWCDCLVVPGRACWRARHFPWCPPSLGRLCLLLRAALPRSAASFCLG
jgi:hypothetical protein